VRSDPPPLLLEPYGRKRRVELKSKINTLGCGKIKSDRPEMIYLSGVRNKKKKKCII
jgi:hypothetical protein